MKLHEICNEMTMKAGNLDALATKFVDLNKDQWKTGEYVGDIENFKVKKFSNCYSLWLDDEIISSLDVKPEGEITFVGRLWTNEKFRGQKVLSKFLWFLKTQEKYSKMVLCNIHSTDTQAVVTHGLSRFDKSWYKDGKIEPFSIETLDKYYSHKHPTGWQLMLENDGAFTDWPRFKNGGWVKEDYSWQIE